MTKFIEHGAILFIVIGSIILSVGCVMANNLIMSGGLLLWAVGSACNDLYISPHLATPKEIFRLKRESK